MTIRPWNGSGFDSIGQAAQWTGSGWDTLAEGWEWTASGWRQVYAAFTAGKMTLPTEFIVDSVAGREPILGWEPDSEFPSTRIVDDRMIVPAGTYRVTASIDGLGGSHYDMWVTYNGADDGVMPRSGAVRTLDVQKTFTDVTAIGVEGDRGTYGPARGAAAGSWLAVEPV